MNRIDPLVIFLIQCVHLLWVKVLRLDVSKWFLFKSECFFEEKIVWTDEKYFVLKQGTNKSIHKVWAPVNPYIDIECKSQS